MFSKSITLVIIIMIVFIMSLSTVALYADCDMAAMIAKEGFTISDLISNGNNYDYNDPYDFFQFLKDRSHNDYYNKRNDDGYGILYYKADGYFYLDPTDLGHEAGEPGNLLNQAWYQVDGDCSVDGDPYDTHNPYTTYYVNDLSDQDCIASFIDDEYTWKWELDTAEETIMTESTDAIIVLGHDRQGTGGSGNHPFRLLYNDQIFTFMQNGGIEDGSTGHPNEPNIKEILLEELIDANWFNEAGHESNWEGDPDDVDSWIDSEIFFHWVMKNIDDKNGFIIEGIHQAITSTVFDGTTPVNLAEVFSDPYSSRSEWVNCINFVLSDGNDLYVFKNAESYDSQHTIFLQTDLDEFYSVNTYISPGNNTELAQFDFVKISRDEDPVIYPNFLDIDIKTYASGVTWTSCPRLTEQSTFNGELYGQAYYEYGDPGLLQETYQGEPTINEFIRIDGKRGLAIDIQPVNNNWIPYDNDFDNMLFRHEGYKIEVAEGADPTILVVEGDRLESYTLEEMPALENFWLGYYVPYTQNIEEAFGDFFGDINRVWAEDWYYDAHKIQRDGAQFYSNSTKGKTMEYGKMYIVQMYYTVENFSWNGSSTVEEPIRKSTPQNFSYTEKADYEVIDVVSIPSNVTEIGVFEDDICVGAIAVEDSCAQILVYSDSANRDPIPFNFEVVTGRGSSTPFKDYLVFNQMTGEFEPSVIISGRQGYSAIKFGEQEEPENIISRPVLNGNYPNPFNPTTKISFSLPTEQEIELTIFNIKGQKVKTLYSGSAEVGEHTVIWEGKDNNDKSVSSGIYFYKLKTNSKELTRKMLMMK